MTSASPNPALDLTAAGMLAVTAARFPDREAIVTADQRIPYTEFHRQARRFARALLAHGVTRGDKVAIWLPNRPSWFFCASTPSS